MTNHLSKIPRGMRYYVGVEARLRRSVEDCAMGVFDGWSYEEIITPSVDYYSLFEQGMGAEARRAFRLIDPDGRMLALRPDVTSSVARAAATLLSERTRPLRLCYTAPVFRQRPQTHAEWRRESTQLGGELIGAGGNLADLEVLLIAVEILERLGLKGNFCITLNSAEVFNGIAERLALDRAAREQMRALIDIRDAAELRTFLDRYDTSAEEREVFSRLTLLSGKREIIDEARRVITNPRTVAALDALETLWSVIVELELADSFEIDLGDVAGLDYYTGLVFKVYVSGAGTRVGRGGRYDELTANFGCAETATGFVLNLDALTDVLVRREGKLSKEQSHGFQEIQGSSAIEIFRQAAKRRAANQRVRVCLDAAISSR